MKIKALYLENIQSWTKPTTIYLADGLNIIKGKNDSGKSASQYALRIFSNTMTVEDYKSIISHNKEQAKVKLYLSNRTILEAVLKTILDKTTNKRSNLKFEFTLYNWQETIKLKTWDSPNNDIVQYLELLSTESGTCLNLTQLEKKAFINTTPIENTEIVDLFTSLPFVDEKIDLIKDRISHIENIKTQAEIVRQHYNSKLNYTPKPIQELSAHLNNLKQVRSTLSLLDYMKANLLITKLLESYKKMYSYQVLYSTIYTNSFVNQKNKIIKNIEKILSSYQELNTLNHIKTTLQVYSNCTALKDAIQSYLSYTTLETSLKLTINQKMLQEQSNKLNASLDELSKTSTSLNLLQNFEDNITTILHSYELNSIVNNLDEVIANINLYKIINNLLHNNIALVNRNSQLFTNTKMNNEYQKYISNSYILDMMKDILIISLDLLNKNTELSELKEKISKIPTCPTCGKPF